MRLKICEKELETLFHLRSFTKSNIQLLSDNSEAITDAKKITIIFKSYLSTIAKRQRPKLSSQINPS